MNARCENRLRPIAALLFVAVSGGVHADVVTDWNARAATLVAALPGTPPAVTAMAMTQVAVHEAICAIQRRPSPFQLKIDAASGASIDAAVAAATRGVLSKTVPTQQAAIDAAYQAALAPLPEGTAKADGIAAGEKAAAAVLALRASDATVAPNTYRPHTTAGQYVPTVFPVALSWGQRKPWMMSSAQQFRPGPPPALNSDTWARDFNEVKAMGAKTGSQRNEEQTQIARFWEATLPAVYWPIARSVAAAPGRDVARNARLLAAAGVAMDDALIAVFDAKYAYNFWRPVTAIRNGDLDGNDATARDAGWMPFIDTPMHPEYPCAHCIISASLGAVLEADIGSGATPVLSSTSTTAPGVTRTWTRLGDFVQEVQNARVYDGVHYRNSALVGGAMGKQIGDLTAKTLLK